MDCSNDVVQLLEATNELNYENNSKKHIKNISNNNSILPPKPHSVQKFSKELSEHVKHSKCRMNSRELACQLVDKLSSDNACSFSIPKKKCSPPSVPHLKPDLKKRIKSLKSSGTLKDYFPQIPDKDNSVLTKTLSEDSLISKRNRLINVIEKQKKLSSSECSSENSVNLIVSYPSQNSVNSSKRSTLVNNSRDDVNKTLSKTLKLETDRMRSLSKIDKALDNFRSMIQDKGNNRFIDELPAVQRVKRQEKNDSNLSSQRKFIDESNIDDGTPYSPVIKSRQSEDLISNTSISSIDQQGSRKTLTELKTENIEKVLRMRKDSLKKRRENALLVLEMSKKFAQEEKEISNLEKKAILYLNTKLKEGIETDDTNIFSLMKSEKEFKTEEEQVASGKDTENKMTKPLEDTFELGINEKLAFFNHQINEQENIIRKIDEKIANLSKKDLIHYQNSLDQLRNLCNNVIRHLREKIFETSQGIVLDNMPNQDNNYPQLENKTANVNDSTSAIVNNNEIKSDLNHDKSSPLPRVSSSSSLPPVHEDKCLQVDQAIQSDEKSKSDLSVSLKDDHTSAQFTSECKHQTDNDFIDQDPTDNSQINEISLKDSEKLKSLDSDTRDEYESIPITNSSQQQQKDVNSTTTTLVKNMTSVKTSTFGLEAFEKIDQINEILMSDPISMIEKTLENMEITTQNAGQISRGQPSSEDDDLRMTSDSASDINYSSSMVKKANDINEQIGLTHSGDHLRRLTQTLNENTTFPLCANEETYNDAETAVFQSTTVTNSSITIPASFNNNSNKKLSNYMNKNNNNSDENEDRNAGDDDDDDGSMSEDKENVKSSSFHIESLIKTSNNNNTTINKATDSSPFNNTKEIILEDKKENPSVEDEHSNEILDQNNEHIDDHKNVSLISMEEKVRLLRNKFTGLVINKPGKMTKIIVLGVDHLWNRRENIDWPPQPPNEFSHDVVDDEDIQLSLNEKRPVQFIDRKLLYDMMVEYFEEYFFEKPEENVFSVKNRTNIYTVWNGYQRPTEKQQMLDIVTIQLIKDLDIDVDIKQIVSIPRQYEAMNSRLKSFQITPASIYQNRSAMLANQQTLNPYYRYSKMSQWMMRKKSWPERLIEMELRNESWSHYEAMALKVKRDLADQFWQEILDESLKIVENFTSASR